MKHILLSLTLTAVSAHAQSLPPEAALRQQQYDAVYSHYIEVCGATEYKPIGAPPGGSYGHSVVYIKGVCHDETKLDIPTVRLCNPADGANAGVGISLDYYFKNAAWTAVNGRDFMYYGDVPYNKPFDKAAEEELYQKAMAKNFASGVVFQEAQEKDFDANKESRAHFLARQLFGTEFGVGLARSLYCTRIPIEASAGKSKEFLAQKLVEYFNGLQRRTYNDPKGLVYDLASYNCTHVAQGALAAIGYWPEKETHWDASTKLKQALNSDKVVAPFNNMFDALKFGAVENLPLNPSVVLKSGIRYNALVNFGWLPAHHGVIAEYLPAHSHQNELFETDGKPQLFTLVDEITDNVSTMAFNKSWSVGFNTRAFNKYLKRPEATDLKANLYAWKKQYELAIYYANMSQLTSAESKLYKQYLVDQAASVDNALKVLEGH